MTSLAKGAIGLGGVGAIGGGTLAWQQGVFSSRESIREKLISEGYKILSSSDGSWTQIFEKYKSNENKWKFKDDQINASSGTTDVQKLKDKCASALEGDADDKDEYYKAAKWCVVPRKVESFIASSSLLSTEGDDASVKAIWQKVLSDFKATKEASAEKYAMDGITINSASGQDDANISAIKTGCKTRRDKLHYELDFEKTLEEVKKWCTKDSR